ncbi:MAG TPA: hypothetical protein VGF55_07900 [Gemmataceae bacterium]|jgi:hypothetical protein
MSDRFDALALPTREPFPALPPGPGYGLPPLLPAPPPSPLWAMVRRHWKLLSVCAVVSLGVAYLVGKSLGRPTWQAEATLLYQQVTLSEKQKAAYEHPPSLDTLAGWVRDPALLRQLADEFRLSRTPDELADKYVKVEHPSGTESVAVSFKWPDADVARAALGRLLDLFADYVVTARKEAILLRIEKMDQQSASVCEDEIRRLDQRAHALQDKLARTGQLGDEDLDGSMLARRGELRDIVRREDQKRSELRSDLRFKRDDLPVLRMLVEKKAEPPIKLQAAVHEVERLELEVKHSQQTMDAATEELRTLPLQLTLSKKNELALKLQYLREEIKKHEAAKAGLGKPGGPAASGALEGMDAREFSVKSPPRVAETPVANTRKTYAALTFFGLMAGAVGLLMAYDRSRPPPGGPTAVVRTRVVHVTPPPGGVTVTDVDPNRLSVRIHQWIREGEGPLVTPPPGRPPLTIGPDGRVEEPPAPTNGADADADHLAKRMQQWLGDGQGPR